MTDTSTTNRTLKRNENSMCPLRIPTLTAALLAGTAGLALAQTPRESLSIETTSDLMSPLPGVGVLVQTDGFEAVYVTDDGARTPFIDLDPFASAVLFLGETHFPEGSSVGQAVTHFANGSDDEDLSATVLKYFQPLALETFLSAQAPAGPDPYHTRWTLAPSQGASYGFLADAGILLTPEIVDAYFAYHGLVAPRAYDIGIILRVEPDDGVTSARSFGAGDGVLTLDVAGYVDADQTQDGNPFVADIVHVARTDVDFGTSQLSVAGVGLIETDAGVALAGTIANGDTLVLLDLSAGPDEVGKAYDMLSNAPDLEFLGRSLGLGDGTDGGGGGGGGDSSTGDATDCLPPKPKAPSHPTCDPEKPNYGWNWTKVGKRSCDWKVEDGGPAECDDPNPNPVKHKWCLELEGGMSIGGKISIPGGEVTGGASGKISRKTCVTIPVEFGNGKGCGECVQMFFHVARCSQSWTGIKWIMVRDDLAWAREARIAHDTTRCAWVDGPWESKCNRTCD